MKISGCMNLDAFSFMMMDLDEMEKDSFYSER